MKRKVAVVSVELEGLTKSPFAVLGVTARDDRARILEAAEEQSLIADGDSCQQARALLTNPRRRLDAELAWFPGSSPRVAEQALTTSRSALAQIPLSPLAKANALVMLAGVSAPDSAAELSAFIDELTSAIDATDIAQVVREVNEDRQIAGFPPVTSLEIADEAFRERRQTLRRIALALLDRTPTSQMTDALNMLVGRLREEKRFSNFLHEIIDDYALRAQPYMTKEMANAERLMAKAREVAGSRPDALPPLIDALRTLLGTWKELTHPIQVSATVRGRPDEEGESLAFSVRSLAIDLNNDHDLVDQARQVSDLLASSFVALPRVLSKVSEDAEALERLAAQAAEQDAELAYAADIGMISKSRIAIDRNGIEWRGRRTALTAVRGVRWGAIRRSLNGIPTGTDYLIAWHDGSVSTSAEFRSGAIFEEMVPRIWKAIGFRLLQEMSARLGAGGQLTFGKMLVRNETVVLTRRKMFSSAPVEFAWGDVTVKSADGSFIVEGPRGSKASETMSYRDVDNVHFFEALVRHAFKQGCLRLSDAFKS